MMQYKVLAAALVGISLLPNVAASADAANEAYEKGKSFLFEDYDAAITAFTEAIRLNPRFAEAYCDRGRAYGLKGDHDKAIADCTEAIRLDAKHAESYDCRGRAYERKGEYDKSIADLTEAIRLNPEEAGFHCNRGSSYELDGQHDKAIADYTEAIRLDPKGSRAFCYNRGLAFFGKGEYDKAVADYNEAIRLDPENGFAYCCRGRTYDKKGEYDKAIADFTEAIRLDPKDAVSQNGLAWLRATCSEERFRDGQRAIDHATKACELTKWKYWGCVGTLAAAYAEAGKFDKAVDFQQKAVEMATKDKEKDEMRERLNLYRDRKPYRDVRKK